MKPRNGEKRVSKFSIDGFPLFRYDNISFRLTLRGRQIVARVAQSVERVLGKDEVIGPIPIMGSSTNQEAGLGTPASGV